MTLFILRFIVFSGILYLVYRLLFGRRSFFGLNRLVLLAIPAISILIPLIAPNFTSPLSAEPMISSLLPEVSITGTIYENPVNVLAALNLWWLIYFAGMAIIIVMLILGLGKAWLILKSSSHAFENVHFSEKASGPFAFFTRIVIPASLASSEQLPSVLAHEKAHVDQGHAIDNLIYNLLAAIFWFNPFIHLLQAEMRQTHECLADEQALAGSDPENYSRLILSSVFGSEISFDPANRFFNSSLIKTRITMIYKAKTNPVLKGLYLILIPLIAGLSISSCQKTQDDMVVNGVKTSEIGLKEADRPPLFENCDASAPKEEMIACFHKVIINYITENFEFPEKAKELGLEGKIFVHFNINTAGKVEVTGMKYDFENAINDEAINEAADYASELISNLPKMEPAMKDGKPVAVSMTLPIMLKME